MKSLKYFFIALLLGFLGGWFSLTGLGQVLEEDFGLALLFKWRGAVPAPSEVVIVSIDKDSADRLHLPEDPEKWPRSYYTDLLASLNRQHPALIAFNIFFADSREPASDARFAAEIAKHKNVILANRLKHYVTPNSATLPTFSYDRVIDPLAILEHSALAAAPFPIPKTNSAIKAFWTYKRSAGNISTLPTRVWYCYLAQRAGQELQGLLGLPSEACTGEVSKPPEFHAATTTPANTIPPEQARLIAASQAFAQAPDSLYLNYYGMTGSITTVPFYQALHSEQLPAGLFSNKVLLVGYSETIDPEMNQGFYTVYSAMQGQTVSNVEIAATAVANLLDHSWLLPLPTEQTMGLLMLWCLLLYALARYCTYFWAITGLGLLSLAYAGGAYYSFTTYTLWLPLFTPIVLQMPCFLGLLSLTHYWKKRQDHQKMHQALRLYVPDSVVVQYAKQTGQSQQPDLAEQVQGVCMATDAGQYTRLSERLSPQALHDHMNAYYAVLFAAIRQHDGIISDVIGDAAMALWARPVCDPALRLAACQAALAVQAASARFNGETSQALPTRIGLHFGDMRLGNVGAGDHFEYRAVGDTVNTATRIENLNKLLGTELLASAPVVADLPGLWVRELGIFILKGKTLPIHIVELSGAHAHTPAEWQALCEAFAAALALFQACNWAAAQAAFAILQQTYPQDGPCQFYARYLQHHAAYLAVQPKEQRSTWIDTETALSR